MNGPQHYAAAERLVDRSNAADPERADLLVKQAQVHATLAAAAASLTPVSVQHSRQDGGAWGEALS